MRRTGPGGKRAKGGIHFVTGEGVRQGGRQSTYIPGPNGGKGRKKGGKYGPGVKSCGWYLD